MYFIYYHQHHQHYNYYYCNLIVKINFIQLFIEPETQSLNNYI